MSDSAPFYNPILAIVIPSFNEEAVLPSSNLALLELLDKMTADKLISADSYLLYVDDGSRDRTWELIRSYADADYRVRGLRLAGNVGHQNALIAGLEEASIDADAIVTIDADLQDDTDAISKMVREFREGVDIVFGVRDNRDSDTRFKRWTAQGFYKLMRHLGVNSVYNHADFRLMSAEAVRDFLLYDERNIFIRGIIPCLGRNQSVVTYARRPRTAGETKYPLKKMLNFAIDGITSFSVRPVRMVFFLGLIFLLVALGIFIYVIVRHFTGHTNAGWTSLMLSIWFCSGILLISLGIIGEYIGKIYTEVKHRPRYAVRELIKPSTKNPPQSKK
ncbi:MAG: glycosyltransferase family 2 protein [Muribaculaceae bacterium]|nr:glycosyltransferase family 2 protein [Muribaculaceae bacterium]